MRLTLLLTQSLDSPGGTGRFMPLAKSLVGLGHEVTILALHHDYRRLSTRQFIDQGLRVWYVGQMHVKKDGSHKTYYGPLSLLAVSSLATLRLTWANIGSSRWDLCGLVNLNASRSASRKCRFIA